MMFLGPSSCSLFSRSIIFSEFLTYSPKKRQKKKKKERKFKQDWPKVLSFVSLGGNGVGYKLN